MTVATASNRVAYAGDDTTTSFATTGVAFYDNTDLDVYLVAADGTETLQTLTTHYTVTGGDGSTGTVEMITAPATGETLVILRVLPITQLTDLVNNDGSDAEVSEEMHDRIVMICQQLNEIFQRTVVFGPGSAITGITFPDPSAGLFIRWNTAEDGFENVTIADAGALEDPVPIANGGTGGTSTTTARANLDLAALAGDNTWTGDNAHSGVASNAFTELTDAATVAVDFTAGNNFYVTVGGNRTIGAPTGVVVGQSGVLIVEQDASGGRTTTFNAAWDFGDTGNPTPDTTAAKKAVVAYSVDWDSTIICTFVGDF